MIDVDTSGPKKEARPFEVTSAMVFSIALPMTLAYISTPLLGLVDTGVVGQLNNPAMLGGLAVGAILFDIVFSPFNFLRSATTGLVAQAMGAGDEEQQRVICIRSLLIALVSGVLVLFVAPLILTAGLSLMAVPQGVAAATSVYFVIRILGAPFTLINYSILGWLLGLARAGTGLALQFLLNGVNIVLSILLGLHMGWGIEGVAWATVFAEAITSVAGLLIFWRSTRSAGSVNWKRVFNRAALVRLFAVNRDIMIRSFALLIAFTFFTAQGAKLGEITLAANAVLLNFMLIASFMLDGLATAAEQLAGRALGANFRPAFDRAVRLTMAWSFLLAAITTLLFFIFGSALIDLLTVNEAIRVQANTYLFWAAITAIAGVLAFQMDGIFIGATWSQEMRNMMLLSLVVYFVIWYFAMPRFGNHGLWFALEVFLAIRGFTLLLRLPGKARRAFGEL